MTDGIAEVQGSSPGFSGDGPAAHRPSATSHHAVAQHGAPATTDLLRRPQFNGCGTCQPRGHGDCLCECDCGALCWLRDEGYFEPDEEWEVADDYHLSGWRGVNPCDAPQHYHVHDIGLSCDCGNHYTPRHNYGTRVMPEGLLCQNAITAPGPLSITRVSHPQDQLYHQHHHHHHHYHQHQHQHQHQHRAERRGGLMRFVADTMDHVRQRSRSRSRNGEREAAAGSAMMSGALMDHEPGCQVNGNVAICGTVCACDDMREGRRAEPRRGGLRRDGDERRRPSAVRRVRFSQ